MSLFDFISSNVYGPTPVDNRTVVIGPVPFGLTQPQRNLGYGLRAILDAADVADDHNT